MAQQKKLQGQQKKKRMGFDLGLAATLILLVFRIPLANVIEDKGNGYLAVSWEVFVLFSLVFSYGFSRAVGSLVKERLRKGQFRNSNRVIKTALVAGTITSVI